MFIDMPSSLVLIKRLCEISHTQVIPPFVPRSIQAALGAPPLFLLSELGLRRGGFLLGLFR